MYPIIRLALSVFAVAVVTYGRQLPFKLFTTADGLPSNSANCIVQDSRGFMWFCTSFGLSRFDGYRFVNYGMEHGLPDHAVNAMLESRDGTYWVGTKGGLYRCQPRALRSLQFEAIVRPKDELAGEINVLLEDHNGQIWVGTSAGLYRVRESGSGPPRFEPVEIGIVQQTSRDTRVFALLEDHERALWIGTATTLFRRTEDGNSKRYAVQTGGSFRDSVVSLVEDTQHRVWAGTRGYEGSVHLITWVAPGRPVVSSVITVKDGLPGHWVQYLLALDDGTIWITTDRGLSEVLPDARPGHEVQFRDYSTVEGFLPTQLGTLGSDREGNLWVNTESAGVMKIARIGFASYDSRDGLNEPRIRSIFEGPSGNLYVINKEIEINRFDGKRFTSVHPYVPSWITYLGWGGNQLMVEDREGEWWIPTGQGLLRFARPGHLETLGRRPPKAVYDSHHGLPHDEVFRVFEDSRGDIWLSLIGDASPHLIRWERSTNSFHAYAEEAGIPKRLPNAFREDTAGQVWIGFYEGGLARYRAGRSRLFETADGVPRGMIHALHLDRSGHLWIASSRGGLGYVGDPTAETPRITSLSTQHGLASNMVSCLTEDRSGRIYAGTGRGIDRIEVRTLDNVLIRHYTSDETLARGFCTCALRDHNGALWFGTPQGLSSLSVEPDRMLPPPAVWIGALRIRGKPYQILDLGEANIPLTPIDSFENHIGIDFFGISFRPGEVLRYQYMLEGADRSWSPPTDQRGVSYASLSPGKYRFSVRAINSIGAVSPVPATLTFQILPPVWGRWWVRLLAAVALGLAIYSLHHYRVARLLELERVRTRIATDLHDDIGASLSQIAMLSEVTRRRAKADSPELTGPLAQIAEMSRDAVDSLSDIVWAINPRRDHLSDLIHRMRRFAAETLATKDIDLLFAGPADGESLETGADVRRQLFLIFKEAVNNAARHSQATQAQIDFSVAQGRLVLRMHDNGRGFVVESSTEGNGLLSIRRRASELGGEAEIRSAPGRGTEVYIRIPIGR